MTIYDPKQFNLQCFSGCHWTWKLRGFKIRFNRTAGTVAAGPQVNHLWPGWSDKICNTSCLSPFFTSTWHQKIRAMGTWSWCFMLPGIRSSRWRSGYRVTTYKKIICKFATRNLYKLWLWEVIHVVHMVKYRRAWIAIKASSHDGPSQHSISASVGEYPLTVSRLRFTNQGRSKHPLTQISFSDVERGFTDAKYF